MTTSKQHIESKYKVPCGRNQVIRTSWRGKGNFEEGRITGWNGLYLVVRLSDNTKITVHPCDLDYLVNGEWKLGKEFGAAYNAGWDYFNARAAAAHMMKQDAMPAYKLYRYAQVIAMDYFRKAITKDYSDYYAASAAIWFEVAHRFRVKAEGRL